MDEVRLRKITDSIGLMQKNLECSICLDLLQDPVSTKCDHQFCNFCVLALLHSSSKPSARCPLCKVVITKRSLTKNEQLDGIVKAVRSVITAVEEDSGLRCSPPRGPVLFSQPDPKSREPTPQKKVKGKISSKVKGQQRAGNVRKTKRKAAESVSVYRDDSSDSDALELPLVGHTNISSSFPRLKTSGKKGYHDDDQENEELEKEAEDLLAALNAAPLTSHRDIISGYSNEVERLNNEINLLPINSGHPEEKRSCILDSQPNISQNPMTHADSEIFAVPAPRVLGQMNNTKEGDQDPYEFVPSQRTPRKVKKKVGRKKNQNGKKEFPIRKGMFTKLGAPKRDHRSASSCSESDQDSAINQSKTEDKGFKHVASVQRNAKANSKGQNATRTSSHLKDRGKESHTHLAQEDVTPTAIFENVDLVDSADVVIDDTVARLDNKGGDCLENNGNAQDKAPPVERNLIKHPLPITPVVVIRRPRGACGNIQGSQQSSEGGMMTDSQPVVINRNHGRRVFATTYGKVKNGVDKSPPLDPQERILDWLVSKKAGSDESDDDGEEEKEKEGAEYSEEFPDILDGTDQGTDDVNSISLPLEEGKCTPKALPKVTTMVDQLEPVEESKEDQSNKMKLTPQKKDKKGVLESRNGRRHSGRHNRETREEKRTLDHAGGDEEIHDIEDSAMNKSTKNVDKESPPRRRTVKQRMEENFKEQAKDTKKESEAARKESKAAIIKSDWELALELARQFGTEPEHLKGEPTETGGRSSRRRKGKLTIEKVPESTPVRKSKGHVQVNWHKENKESNETIDIDSFETQNLNRIPVKTTVKERSSTGADKRKASTSDKRKASPGSQRNIHANDPNSEVLQNDTPEANILIIPETPYILDQPKGKKSLKGELSPETGIVELECQEQNLESSRPGKVEDTKSSLNQHANDCTSESKSSQLLTPSLRRSKRGSHPGRPNSNNNVSEEVLSGSVEKKKKAKVLDEVKKNETDPGRTRGVVRELSGAGDVANEAEFSFPAMEKAEREAGENIDVEEPALASLPLYTEDIPNVDNKGVSPKKCRGSDTTESIDLEIDSDEYEDPDGALEKEFKPSTGGSSAKKNVCSSPKKQQKPPLDDEMSIMDCILPSIYSQEHPALGISPGPSGTASDQVQTEKEVYLSKKPDEVLTVLSGSSSSVQQASQASVTIISQTKTSGSFPVSLDLNSQPSESLLQPLKQSKRKASEDGKKGSNLHTPDSDIVKEPTMQTSPGAKQQVDSLKTTCGGSDLQGVQTSSGSGNSRPTRRISRRKRKTFTIDTNPSVPASKEIATPPSQKTQKVPDSLEQTSASSNKSNLTKEANQYQKDPEAPSCKGTCEADADIDFVENMEALSCQRAVRKGSKSPQDRNTLEVVEEKLTSQQTASPVTRKKSRSLPLSDSQRVRKGAVKNIEDSAKASPSCANTSQETLVSVVSRSSLTLKRKSRSGGRLCTQSPVLGSDVEEPLVQPSPSNLGDDFDGNCNEASSLRGGRRSSSRRNKIHVSTKSEGLVSDGSAIQTTQGASEMNERSSDVIISARAFQLQSKKTLHEGPENPWRTPGSSPRVLRRSARQSRDMVQPRNESAMSNTAKEEQEIEQKISTPPQECITIVDESIGMSLAEKEEAQESNMSLHCVEDTCNLDEDSRDMFDEEETAGNQEAMRIEESQSMIAEILPLSKDLHVNAEDDCSSSGVDDAEKPSGDASQCKQEVQKKTPRTARKSPNPNVPNEIDETKAAVISQGSCQYEDTEALIPPTPPCHDMSKSRMSSFLHTSGLSKALPKKKKAQGEMEPDMSSLLCLSEDTITKEQDFVWSKSLVMETPTVVSRKRNKVPQSQTDDKSIADTPVKRKRGSVDRREKMSASDQNAVTVQGGDQEDAFEHPELSPREPSVCDLRLDGPLSKTCRKVTSQIIGDTQSEPPFKSSNESDEVPKTNIRRRKQVITDDVSDDDVDEEEEEEEGFIGRQKRRKSQRMVQVARDEEDESDDELIPCSFLQTSVQKPVEKEDDDEDNPVVLFGDHTDPQLSHGADGGSVSSEDSCASHHMNLTSASSIPSSQSEIMNTQQQEKTREDMQALEEQMAELHAALARERGSRSHDDTNDEEVEENPQGFIVEETEGASTPASKKQNNSASSRHRSPGRTKRRSNAVETSDEEDEMDDEKDMIEPRSPSPPPPLSPSTVRKASSSLSMTDSIRSVTSMVEQYRKSSSKKVTTKKRRIEDDVKDASDDDGSDDDVAMVSCKSSRNTSSPMAGSSRTSSKKRRIDSVDSDEDLIQDSRVNSPAKSRSNSVGRTVEQRKTVHPVIPPSRTTPTLSSSRASGRSLSKTPHGRGHNTPGIPTPRGHQTPKIRTLQDRLTPRRTPEASSVPSPVDVSMKTQRTRSEGCSPAQSERRSGDQSLRTSEAGPGPSPRPSSRPMSLIATGLNRLELRQVEQLTSRLANCRFASAFNANTTHVIVKTDSTLVCERTLKYFQGIAARAWIVSFQWVHDSLKARKILAEEDYEVRGDVVNGEDHHGPKRARTVEGPGFMAKFDLCCIGPFTGLNKDQLVGLCEMCGASTVQHPSLFPYNPGRKAFIIVEPNLETDRDYKGLQRKFRVPVISREWVLDSIALYKSQPITEYLLSDFTSPMTDQPIVDLYSDDDQ